MTVSEATWMSPEFGPITVVERACPHCGRDDSKTGPGSGPGTRPGTGETRYGRDIWRVSDCAGCGFVYLGRAPDYAEMVRKMAWETSSKAEDHRRAAERAGGYRLSKKTRKRLHLFPRKDIVALVERYAAPGPVIDLGCGDGAQIARLDARFTPCGVEISEHLAERARARLAGRPGLVVTAPALDGLEQFPEDHFTGALLRSYLEHEMNPVPVLDALYRALAPGGIAVIKVPNYGSLNRRVMGSKWCGFRFPDHLNYFTPTSLRRMVEGAGFGVRRFRLFDRLPTGDNMWMIVEK